MNQPQALSNFVDDFVAGGIYGGGSGIANKIGFVLWDYDGRQPPNSVCAVHLLFQPTDGSNEGKPVDVYWSVGPAADFQPDHTGGFVFSATRAGLPSNSNWGAVCNALKMTCGLDDKQYFNGPQGILALVGGEMTLTRMDQPARDGLDNAPPQPGQQKRKPTFLCPTRFRGAWERGGARPAMTTAPVMQMPTQVPMQPTAPPQFQPPPQQQFQQPVVQASPMAMPGNNGGGFSSGSILLQVLAERGGVIAFSDLSKAALDKLVAAPVADRMKALTELGVGGIAQVAQSVGVSFDGNVLMKAG